MQKSRSNWANTQSEHLGERVLAMFGGEQGKKPTVEPLPGDIETQSRLAETWLDLPLWRANSRTLVREGSLASTRFVSHDNAITDIKRRVTGCGVLEF